MSVDHNDNTNDETEKTDKTEKIENFPLPPDIELPLNAQFLPVLPLRDIVVFPHMVVPLFVGREKSIKSLDLAMRQGKRILLLAQKDGKDDSPTVKDYHRFGVIGHVLQVLKLPDGTVKVLVEGMERVRVTNFHETPDHLQAVCHLAEEDNVTMAEAEQKALMRAALNQFEQYIKLNKKISSDIMGTLESIDDIGKLADSMAAHLPIKIAQKQEMLEILQPQARLEKIFSFIEGEVDVLETERKIRKRVKGQMEKSQRDYYLNEQIKAIQKELDGDETGNKDVDELEAKIKAANMPKDIKDKATSELKKLRAMSPMSPESTIVRNYVEWLANVPWGKRTKTQKDLLKAEKVLDADHYGLEKVKERIVEYIAVQQRTLKIKGSILCLVGPPGVGKTSLGQSIAKATGRKFVRMALGGVHDESEIRGHRRTYLGALPGRIIQGMKKAGTSNPVFMLDEIDKLGRDMRGDPSSALLEVLDPEQNSAFNDHYLEVDYDLSDVMFICTANSTNMPRPLLDRMEIIRLEGYTEDEKITIAQQHLVAKQIEQNGLKPEEITITEDALRNIVRYFTREAGVRSLEREIAKLCRKVLKQILSKKATAVEITAANLDDFLGVRKFKFGEAESENQVGLVTGLAWTEVGGDMLSIEAATLSGDGKVTTTGQLGDVMKESITAAEMLIKSRAADFGIDPKIFKTKNIHVHVPEGGTPKDGPSAGIGMVTAIVSALNGIPVRRDVAMTGEVTLRGRVLPIGGLKEKLLAALRGGISTVVIPADNVKDLAEIPDNVKNGLEIVPVSAIDQVLAVALVTKPMKFIDENQDVVPTLSVKPAENMPLDTIRH